jgi:hypothetical protein
VLPATVSERLVLHAPAALVELLVRELDHVEGVGDLGEHLAIGAREIEGRVADLGSPRAATLGKPRHGFCARAARDDVQELTTADVNDLGGELLAMEGASSHHERFVHAERVDGPEATGIVDEGLSVGDDGVVHGVPVAAELSGDLVDTPRTASHLRRRPTAGTIGHGHARSCDPVVGFGPAASSARWVRTAPPALVPHEARRPAEARQVDERHRTRVLEMCICVAAGTLWTGRLRLDVDVDHRRVEDSEHVDVGEPHEHFAHLGWVGDEVNR